MENNKEIKIAIIVGALMLTACLVAYIFYKSSTKVENIDIKVYKNYTTEDGRAYYECNISTEDLLTINSEYKRLTNLKKSESIKGASITGTYMIRNGEDYIAFDATESNLVFFNINGNQAIYELTSTMYDIVKNACSVMDSKYQTTETEEDKEA